MLRIELPGMEKEIVDIFFIAEGTALTSMSTVAFFKDNNWADLIVKESRTMEWEGQTDARFGTQNRSFYNEQDLKKIEAGDNVAIEVTIKPSGKFQVDLQTLNHEITLHVRSAMAALEYLRECYAHSKKTPEENKKDKREPFSIENMRDVLYRYFFFTAIEGKPHHLGAGNVHRDHINLSRGGTVAMLRVHEAMRQLLQPAARKKLDAEFKRDVTAHRQQYGEAK